MQIYAFMVGLDVLISSCLSLVSRFVDSNPEEDDGFKGGKNSQHGFLRRGGKAVGNFTICYRTLQSVKDIFHRQNLPLFLAKFLLIRYRMTAGICQRALVDEFGMIQLRWGRAVDQKIVAVHGELCTILPRNINQ